MGTDRDPGDLQHQNDHNTTASRPMSPRNPKLQAARVRLPDGQFKEFELNRGSEGEILFRQVTADLSIEEREYFSLCFYDKTEGARHWLYNDKKILRQLKGLPWEFSFEVKFYPTTPSTLVDDHARYYLFLQLRRDILTGRLPATTDTHALLGSFVAQIEYGDAPSQITDNYEKFIVESKLVPESEANPEVYKQIAELHRELRAQTTSEAENLYLDHCRQLALYGIHLYPAKDKDQNSVQIGIGAAGINIYQGDNRVHRFGWQNIVKISYRKNTFSVRLKAGELDKKETTVNYKLVDYQHAKRTWKCAVEHHTFFRLIQPDEPQKSSLLNFGSQRFRYHGRTQFQTKMASQMFDKPSIVERSPSAMSQPIESGRQVLSPLHYTDNELEQKNYERSEKKNKKDNKKSSKKGKKENDSSETSDSEHDEKREFAVVEFQSGDKHANEKKNAVNSTNSAKPSPSRRSDSHHLKTNDEPMNEVTVLVTSGTEPPAELGATRVVRHETREQQYRLSGNGYTSGFNPNEPESGQPYTTVSTWQEQSDLPEQVEVFTDENGRQITRTIKSSQVKHTVQTQSFQNYIVDGDQVPVGVVEVERSREQLTPIGQQAGSSSSNKNGGVVETQTRTMTYESAAAAAAAAAVSANGDESQAPPPGWAEEGLGEYVSSKSVTQGNRTIETITYKTEKDGIIETHVEHRVTIHSDGDIDHDAELSQAILEATQMNPDMVVEKIEVRQETTQ